MTTAFHFESNRIGSINNVEGLLCLATLVAVGEIGQCATLPDATIYYMTKVDENCGNCPYNDKCLACIINE